ncbi:MAG: hypothetical protein AB7N91_13715 [Candidatus Tectimicrobiota bacterium]
MQRHGSSSLCLLLSLSLLVLAGCQARVQQLPALATRSESRYAATRDRVFEAALFVAQDLNLNVAVLEKPSGFLRFEMVVLTPAQLDKYCQYPWVTEGSKAPLGTFQTWHQRASSAGAGGPVGTVSLTLLFTAESPDLTIAHLRSQWTARTPRDTIECNSLGVFEKEFETALRRRLGL